MGSPSLFRLFVSVLITCMTMDSLQGNPQSELLLLRDPDDQRLYQVDLHTGNIVRYTNVSGNDSVVGLATNTENTRIYWADNDEKRIMSSSLNGSDVTTVFNIGMERALSLTVDPSTGNIYYTGLHNNSYKYSFIAVLSPDGQLRKEIISGGMNYPKGIEVHSAKGYNSLLSSPAGRLYWCDAHLNVIKKCSLSGDSCETIVSDPGAHISSLVVVGDNLYYTAFDRLGITVVHKDDGSGRRALMFSPLSGKLRDLVLVTPNKTSSVDNGCSDDNGGCTGLCLPTNTGKTCCNDEKCDENGGGGGGGGAGGLSTTWYKTTVFIAAHALSSCWLL